MVGGGCVVRLGVIASAKEQWALENQKTTNDTPTWAELRPHLPDSWTNIFWTNGVPFCPSGGFYIIGRVGDKPKCSIGGIGHSLD